MVCFFLLSVGSEHHQSFLNCVATLDSDALTVFFLYICIIFFCYFLHIPTSHKITLFFFSFSYFCIVSVLSFFFYFFSFFYSFFLPFCQSPRAKPNASETFSLWRHVNIAADWLFCVSGVEQVNGSRLLRVCYFFPPMRVIWILIVNTCYWANQNGC